MRTDEHNILIVGVGGQGVLLASELISKVAMDSARDVKKSEVHGMSQRGGVVSSHVRIGTKVYSPTIEHGQADVLLAFEQAEGLRAIDHLREDGVAIVSSMQLVPAVVTASKQYSYPEDALARIEAKADNVISVPADTIAGELGNPRLVNTILIGILSNFLPYTEEVWIDALKAKIKPKLLAINLKAFERGRLIGAGATTSKVE